MSYHMHLQYGTQDDYRMPLFNSPKNILSMEQIRKNKDKQSLKKTRNLKQLEEI